MIRRAAALLPTALLAAACGGPTPPQDPAWFVDEAAARGFEFSYRSGHRERHLFPEIIGGGAALVDVDGDGDLDAYLLQGGELESPGSPDAANRLFLNDGGGRFTSELTDADPEEVAIGMRVRMTFRRMLTADGVHNYFWKATPIR